MNFKPISIATFAAIYSIGMTASVEAASHSSIVKSGLKQISPTNTVKTNQTKKNAASKVMRAGPGGLNQMIQPVTEGAKFRGNDVNKEQVYIVRLNQKPIATYDGSISGYPATSKSKISAEFNKRNPLSKSSTLSQKVNDTQKQRASSYKQLLIAEQNKVLSQAQKYGINTKTRTNYTNVINGFSITMSKAEAEKMSTLPGVAFVEASTMLQLHTDRGPTFIGADKIWQGTAITGEQANVPYKGEGQIVGIIDTGINSDHIAFAEKGVDGYQHINPNGDGVFLGDCADGTVTCNAKLIGVYSWPVITDTYEGNAPATGEDIQGHGSHTAGTAAGNYVENVPLLAPSIGDGDGVELGFNFASTSGVAPHANIISYQVCIPDAGCPTEAVLKAYEQAVVDNVDVINFSIGGWEQFPWEDATELAILSAREAGISVAVSAGNAGGDENNTYFSSLSHSAPWSMVVAASTTDRVVDITNNMLTLSGGVSQPYLYIDPGQSWPDDIAGYSQQSIVDGKPVLAVNYGDELCANEFAADTFTSDQIVICKRGENARVAKAHNVKNGGAGGFILYNEPWSSEQTEAESMVFDDAYPLPGLHVSNNAGNNIINWLNDGNSDHKITITGGSIAYEIDADKGDILADFSSLGPSSTYSHHLAPHVSAPGVNILAPYADQHPLTPEAALSQDWSMISGTSMASPHVAGAMALVRQAHPDWTATEVQSALEMTASQTVKRDVDENYQPDGHPATQHRAGAGRIDVAKAVNTGLVMNETVENFTLANPELGGDVRQLNVPQLVDSNCRAGVCTWLRTVTATKDGSWKLESDDWAYDRWISTIDGEIDVHTASLEFFPASFALTAGESQSIVIKANVQDVQYQYNSRLGGSVDIQSMELWSNVKLVPQEQDVPALHWPISVNFDRKGLPDLVAINAHRNDGNYQLNDIPLSANSDLAYQGLALTKAQIESVTLPQDNNHQPVYTPDQGPATEHNKVTLVDIPQDTARFVVEVLAHTDGPGFLENYGSLDGTLAVHIGRDYDDNGEPDFDKEWVCSSTTQLEMNYCSLTNPEPGKYWVVLSNTSLNMYDWMYDPSLENDGAPVEGLVDTYDVATAVVPKSGNTLEVTGPQTHDGGLTSISLDWNIGELVEGDIVYTGFTLGTSIAPDALGMIPVKIIRNVDELSTNINERAKGGDILDVNLHLVQNNSGVDREINLQAMLPEGLSLVEDSVKISDPVLQSGLTVEGNVISIVGTQLNTGKLKPSYNITTNLDDLLCKVPNYGSNSEGFVGLYKNYGFAPEIGGSAVDWVGSWNSDWTEFTNPFELDLSTYWGEDAHINLFHNESYMKYPSLYLSPQGFVSFDFAWYAGQHITHQKFPYIMSPFAPFLGVFWKGEIAPEQLGWNTVVNALGTPLNIDYGNIDNTSGMSIGYANDPATDTNDIIIEWINSRTQQVEISYFGDGFANGIEFDDRYSFELILSQGYRYAPGQFEIIMAYDDIDFADQNTNGSIGIHGNTGPLDIYGYPYGDEIGLQFALNELDEKVKDNMVVCYDYVGPESSQFDVTFQVKVAETAAGQTLDVEFTHDSSGLSQTHITKSVEIAGNINLGDFKDQTIDENESFDISVIYNDKNVNGNIISVTGDNITADVKGHTLGSIVTISPVANWYGETEVTVTVTDSQVATDSASKTFMLTVLSDGEEPVISGCTDSSATNYNANATSNDGSCKFPEAEEDKSSGGSMAWLTLLLVPFVIRRRQSKVK
ncbi:S8 family serine peptidase [Psychrosphaera aquimarina]|uniref:S8 family serine peptidase n=1 Tax=Psychrosphaera aquimarina TaxID=2044854 RepID=A0ABU3QWR7_9GAMM|nr:S8 family serine peptidase [Psychrosphaera aquimarina]MDU0111879.1 S8 family serine peptidase [Psychrosphaera aquimarina]